MDGEAVAFIFALLNSGALLFMSIYYLVAFSDLESGFIDSSTCCDRANKIVIPEVVLISLLSFCLIYFGCFGSLMFSVPMLAWLLYRIAKKPAGNISHYDPAEIHNRNKLKQYTRESIVKLMYHLVGFFIYLYSMVVSILADEPLNSIEPPPFLPMHNL